MEKRPRELKNDAKRGKRGEKEATREAQRRPKRDKGGPKGPGGTLEDGEVLYSKRCAQTAARQEGAASGVTSAGKHVVFTTGKHAFCMKIHPQGFQNRVSGCLGIPSSSQIHPRAPREAQKVRGRPPKVDFWGPGPFLEFRPGPPKTRFGPHRVLLGGSGMPKWSHFHPKTVPGAKNAIFRKSY